MALVPDEIFILKRPIKGLGSKEVMDILKNDDPNIKMLRGLSDELNPINGV
ncbi:MAG: hypothetical protein SVM80_02180 [Halobacteriota archaeon]|nr:hypothetical protein [Halobacteriota archaeon]